MALSFNKQKGSAQKSNLKAYEYPMGDNKVRIVGDILPRYVYWVPGENNKNLPMECLEFDREAEAFLKKERDYVKEFFPDIKCSWNYATQCIDPRDGEVKVLNLKKKLWEQVVLAAEDLGDPTDPENGWDLVFKKVKTGPHAYNIEYQLQVLKCKPRPLTPKEREAIADLKSMDEVMSRPTPENQRQFLEKITKGSEPENENMDEELEEEFNV